MSDATLHGDTDYRKPEKALLIDLLNKASPGFSDKFPADELEFVNVGPHTPTVDNPDDTEITLRAVFGSTKVLGTERLSYRRIDLSKLFRGRTLVLTKYSTMNTLPYSSVLAVILEQLGVNIDPSSLDVVNLGLGVTTTLQVRADSRCYKGALTVRWVHGKRDIGELLGDNVLAGRVWPDGLIDFQDGSKPQGEYLAYDVDFTATMAAQFNAWGSGSIMVASLATDGLVSVLRSLVPKYNWNDGSAYAKNGDDHVEGGVVELRFVRYVLPNPAVPEANAGLYSRVAVLEPVANTPWFFGRLLFHYN